MLAERPNASSPVAGDNVLEIEDLEVRFKTEEGEITAVDGITLDIPRGSTMGLVGESGCGKSVTAYSVMRLIQPPGKIAGGRIRLAPRDGPAIDVTRLSDSDDRLYDLRGGKVSMIFQEPMTALSPVHTVGDQIAEAILLHQDVSKEEAEHRALLMIEKVGIPGGRMRLKQYPFEMSGGMRQRVVIAMALVCRPELLIADEPTTALDVTIQAQIMNLLKDLQEETATAILLITHDLGVIAQMADRVAVMYLGKVVEEAPVRDIMRRPRHPYTMGLLASLPGLDSNKDVLPSIRGSVPSLLEIPRGCAFHPRCPWFEAGRCDAGPPPALRKLTPGHRAACLRTEEIGSPK